MGKIKVEIAKYSFNKPAVLNKEEYTSLKQVLKNNPNYDFKQKSQFWTEFGHIKWGLIISISFFAIGLVTDIEILGIIGLLVFFMIFITIIPDVSSMISYNKYQNEKEEYFNKLKRIINDSNSYEEFVFKARNL